MMLPFSLLLVVSCGMAASAPGEAESARTPARRGHGMNAVEILPHTAGIVAANVLRRVDHWRDLSKEIVPVDPSSGLPPAGARGRIFSGNMLWPAGEYRARGDFELFGPKGKIAPVRKEGEERIYRLPGERTRLDCVATADARAPFYLMLPGHEPGELFNRAYLDLFRGRTDCWRTLNWTRIRWIRHGKGNDDPRWNMNPTWKARRGGDWFRWADAHGVPWEIQVAFCNAIGADLWLNIPHGVDSEYVQGLARLVKAELDPSLRVVVEYSNELWNGAMVPFRWADRARGEERQASFAGRKAREAFLWWKEVWDEERVVFTVAGNHASGWLRTHLEAVGDVADAVAAQMYFYGRRQNEYRRGGSKLDSAMLLEHCLVRGEGKDGSIPRVLESFETVRELARENELRLFVYEAGSSLAAYKGPMRQAAAQAQLHPKMGECYRRMYAGMKELGVELECTYSAVRALSSDFGTLFNMENDPPSPKWEAWLQAPSLP